MENKSYGVIYRITNLINNKMYIGQTIKNNPIKRWTQHKYYSKNRKNKTAIARAISKYGDENFTFQILCVCNTQEELNSKEEFFIKKYKTLVSENGYNLLSYCDGRGIVHEETKEKQRKNYITNKHKQKTSRENGLKSRGKKIGTNPSSIYVGVKKYNNKWVSQISINKKKIGLGYYYNEIDAAKAYDIGAIKYFGNDATLNFPELREEYINNEIILERCLLKKNSDAIVGVSYLKHCNRWRARIDNKSKYCKTKEEAESYIYQWKSEIS